MSNDVAILLSAIAAMYIGLCCNTLSKREHIDIWIQTANKRDIFPKAFTLSEQLANVCFGKRLVSARAMVCSLIFSSVFFWGSLEIAFYTTPGLMRDINWHGTGSIVIIISLLLLEYLYVTKTRLILRTIVNERRSQHKILMFFMIDLITTYWMLLFGLAFVLLLSFYCEQIYRTDIDISSSALAVAYSKGNRVFIVWNPYDPAAFFNAVSTFAYLLLDQIASGFRAFFETELWSKTGTTEKGGSIHLVPLVVVPFTTLAASTLATTIWISMCYMAGIIVLGFCKWWYLTGLMAKHLINPNVASAIAAGGALGLFIYVIVRIIVCWGGK